MSHLGKLGIARACFGFMVLTSGIASAETTDYLARAGDCVSCHTAPGGAPFAGGYRMPTPFGAIYSTNITPDRATGIGNWSFADFDRAVRRGIAKDGHHLYPAMPYPSFTKVSARDVHGLYEYFMRKVQPVGQPNRSPEIPWPFDMRWPLAIWNALFLDDTPFTSQPARGIAWNRGAYLVEGLGHCGACHTPRSIAWNELGRDAGDPAFLTGETLDNWSAPDLRGDPRIGLGSWSTADVETFLKSGHNLRGSSFGSMKLVTKNSTPYLSNGDLAAIAFYIKSLPPRYDNETAYVVSRDTQRQLRANPAANPGTVLFLGQCARCHGADGTGKPPRVPPLAGNPAVVDPDSTSVTRIVLDGAAPRNADDPLSNAMPAFRSMLDDRQIASVVTFVRSAWGNRAGPVGPRRVTAIRNGTSQTGDQIRRGAALARTKGCGACHAIPGIEGASGRVGPPLGNIGDRTVIAGLFANTPANMAAWVRWPQRAKPGDAMPDVGLSGTEAKDLTAFLMTLRE